MLPNISKAARDKIVDWLRARNARSSIARSAELNMLLTKGFEFPAFSDRQHIEDVLAWVSRAIKVNGDGGILQMLSLHQLSERGTLTSAPSYPETTGYWLSSLVFGRKSGLSTLSDNVLSEVLKYLLAIQRPDGGFPGPDVDSKRGLAFDTGQILMGLVAYARDVEQSFELEAAITRAADWLAAQIDVDGEYSAASTFRGPRSYYLRGTVGLARAAEYLNRNAWRDAVARSAKWTLACRESGGWFRRFSFGDGELQNLHGIAYTVQGLVDVGHYLEDDDCLDAARVCLDRILLRDYSGLSLSGALPGFYSFGFAPRGRSVSPTGMCQIYLAAARLGALTGRGAYIERASSLIDLVKKCHFRGFDREILNGLLPGSWPITGPYLRCMLPNWPIKFFLDALYIRAGANAGNLLG